MGDKLKILFVCRGNIFRSMTAEYCLKKYLLKNNIKNIEVSSAGIEAKKQRLDQVLEKKLKEFKVPVKNHKQRKITKKIVEDNDVIIAMGLNHQQYIREKFGIEVSLFNEISIGKKTPILDIEEVIKDYKTNKKAVEKFIRKTVDHISGLTPKLYDNINFSYLLFTNFINGKINHRNNLPFTPLYETKTTLAFMSIDIPSKGDGHVIIIPKKRYRRLEDVPQKIVDELMKTIRIIGKTLMLNHEGYNILLNNGEAAEQTIQHVHFHMVPRNKNDDIKIEIWGRRKRSRKEFVRLQRNYKKNINKILNNKA